MQFYGHPSPSKILGQLELVSLVGSDSKISVLKIA